MNFYKFYETYNFISYLLNKTKTYVVGCSTFRFAKGSYSSSGFALFMLMFDSTKANLDDPFACLIVCPLESHLNL